MCSLSKTVRFPCHSFKSLLNHLLVFSSVNLDDDDEMDTSPQSIFIIDKQPMDMADIQTSLQQQEDEEEDLEDSENREELLDEDESVSTSKSAHVNGMKLNSVVDGGQVSSEESEDEDDVMEITTKSLPTESTDSDPSKTADIR